MELNEQQNAVVDWVLNEKGSLILVARAGCGKTATALQGIVKTIRNQMPEDEIALMAFNKEAANEFASRIKTMQRDGAIEKDWRKLQSGTVHSFGRSAIMYWTRKKVKVDRDKVSKICIEVASNYEASPAKVDKEQGELFRKEHGAICKLVSLAKQAAFGFLIPTGDMAAWYDLAMYHAVDDMADSANINQIIKCAIQVFEISVRRDKQVIDFNDMILAPLIHNLRMFQKDWVIIDEAQDTNAARRCLALKMLKRDGRLIAIGDDRQAIYGFTGADADALDLISKEVNATKLPLNITYRCPKLVVAEANRLVPDMQAHESAPEGVVRSMEKLVTEEYDSDGNPHRVNWFESEGVTVGDAVLCRNTRPLLETAFSMLAKGMPCKVEGRDIEQGLINLATRWKRVTTLQQLDEKLDGYLSRETQKWTAKGREDRAQTIEDRVQSLKVVSSALIKEQKTLVTDLVDWLQELFDTDDDGALKVVTMCTIHRSKGREWDRVYLLDKCKTLPSPWARKGWQLLQEENLEYVAITRAKKELIYVD